MDDLQGVVSLYPGVASVVYFDDGDGFFEKILPGIFEFVLPVSRSGLFFYCKQIDGVDVFVRPFRQSSDDGLYFGSRGRFGGKDAVFGAQFGRG